MTATQIPVPVDGGPSIRRQGASRPADRRRPPAPAPRPSRRRNRVLAALAVLGPGLIAANAGNDAGGIATYSSVGATYGYDLLWMMVVITISLIVVQEMAARMGAVTGKGLAELIREQYGVRWSLFATCSVLVANVGICISEFVGIGAALGLAGVPVQVSVPIAAAAVWLLLVRGSYKVAERVFVLMTIPFFAYPIAAVLAHPDWGHVGNAVVAPSPAATRALSVPVHRDRRHHDHAVHAAVRAVGGGRARGIDQTSSRPSAPRS